MNLPRVKYPIDMGKQEVHATDDFILQLNLVDKLSNQLNLTGLTDWRAQTRPYPGSSKVFDFIIDTTQLASGIVTFSLSSSQTKQMTLSPTWGWDVKCVTSTGNTFTIFEGELTIDPNWTDA